MAETSVTHDASRTASEAGDVTVAIEGKVCEIALCNRPLNLVTQHLLESLQQALKRVEADTSVRCVVLHQGTARAFCAGSDMRDFERVRQAAMRDKVLFEEYVVRQLAQLRCPTIAAIDGPALGGGLELALACDIRVAAASARLGLTECNIGGLGGSGAVRLTRLIGPARAAEMLFTGAPIGADEACQWGLVNRVAADGSALALARRLAADIAAKGPLSNAYAKRLIAASQDSPAAAALALANELQDRIFASEDLMAGARSFFEKSKPVFEGR